MRCKEELRRTPEAESRTRDTLDYIADMCRELREMAARCDLARLASLLAQAELEAKGERTRLM